MTFAKSYTTVNKEWVIGVSRIISMRLPLRDKLIPVPLTKRSNVYFWLRGVNTCSKGVFLRQVAVFCLFFVIKSSEMYGWCSSSVLVTKFSDRAYSDVAERAPVKTFR